jgi:hypothetical protein
MGVQTVNPQDQSKWLRTKPAAAHINSTKSTLEKKRVYGGGPAYSKIGRTVVYNVDDLDAYMAQNRRSSTSETVATV